MLSRVHSCFSQHLGESLPSRRCTNGCNRRSCFRDCKARGVECLCRRCSCVKCGCKKLIDLSAAREEVQEGRAQWVIVKVNDIIIPKICSMCGNDDLLKKSCLKCFHLGTELETVSIPIFGTDIVLSSEVEIREEKGIKKEISRTAIAKRTPRVATIEKAHMERAYVSGDKEEQERIAAYGESNLEFLNSLIAPFREDPYPDRPIFVFAQDLRTSPGLNYAVRFLGIPWQADWAVKD
jgi:hypothetical protein